MATLRPSQSTSTILFPGFELVISLTISPAGIVTATRFPFTSPIASVVLPSLNFPVCVAHLQCKRLFVLPVHWRSLRGQKRFNVAARRGLSLGGFGIAAPGVPLVRAVRPSPARSLSDSLKMPSAVPGVQISFHAPGERLTTTPPLEVPDLDF